MGQPQIRSRNLLLRDRKFLKYIPFIELAVEEAPLKSTGKPASLIVESTRDTGIELSTITVSLVKLISLIVTPYPQRLLVR